jgi:hypothetical protein
MERWNDGIMGKSDGKKKHTFGNANMIMDGPGDVVYYFTICLVVLGVILDLCQELLV